MGVKPYYPDKDPMTVGVGRSGRVADVVAEDTGSVTGVGSRPGGTDVAAADTLDFVLRQVAAGMQGGVPPQQFLDNIYAASRQLGNRAFLRWVSELRTRGRDTGSHTVAAGGGQAQQAACPAALSGPLQLMPKKKKKKADPDAPETQQEAPPDTGAAAMPGAQATPDAPAVAEKTATPAREEAGETTGAVEKKKRKKSRVQVALNILRSENVAAFVSYIEAEIAETELLYNLRARITRAQDLGSIKEAALKAVQTRLRSLNPEVGPGIAATSEPGPAKDPERPVVAQIKTQLNRRERDLIEACLKGDVRKFKRLLRQGNIDINMDSQFGTPLGLAAYKGHAAIVSELLSKPGIDVNLAQEDGATPLLFAAQEGYVEIVGLLLGARGINVNLQYMAGITPLLIAAQNGHGEVVNRLLAFPNVNVNACSFDGMTALYYAAEKGFLEIVKLLLAAPGINGNSAGIGGSTPLYIAAQNGHEEVVKLLLNDPNIKIDARKGDGATALFVAVQFGFSRIIELLIKHGADVNLAINDKTPPISIGITQGHIEVVRLLLQAPGIQVNQRGLEQTTPLCYSSSKGYKDIVKLLLRKGADPNIASDKGIAPLHAASLRGHTAVVRMLLHAGADMEVEMKGAEGKRQPHTPYSLAELAGHREVIALFAAHRRSREEEAALFEKLSIAEKTDTPSAPTETQEAVPVTLRAGQPGADLGTPPAPSGKEAGGERGAPGPATVGAATVSSAPAPAGGGASETKAPSPLGQAQDALRQEVLRKLEQDNLEPLEGIRLLEDVNASTDIDVLCALYNRLAHIERHKERARRRGRRREQLSVAVGALAADPASAGAPLFALGGREGLDAEGVEGEIRAYLEQRYHRFVGQVLNDMEFGRGKRTTGYPGMWHASAGISGVGSCSVFYYSDEETQRIRIVGIGHHVGRAAYRLDYATAELGEPGRILRIA